MKFKKFFFFLLYSSIGCACRFLYGPETKDDNKAQIEKSLDGKIELKLEVIFYKKNGMLIRATFSQTIMCMFTVFSIIHFCLLYIGMLGEYDHIEKHIFG